MAVETENTAPLQRPVEQKDSEATKPLTNPNEPRLYPSIPITSVQFPKSWARTYIPTQTPHEVTVFSQEVTFTILHSEELKGINPSERKWLFWMWASIERVREDLEFDVDGLDEKRIDEKEKWIEDRRVELEKAFEFARSYQAALKRKCSSGRLREFWRWMEAKNKVEAEEKVVQEEEESEG